MAATGELRKLGSFKLDDVHDFYEDDHDVGLEPSLTSPAVAASSAVPGNPTGMLGVSSSDLELANMSSDQDASINMQYSVLEMRPCPTQQVLTPVHHAGWTV